jgi:uncharacterized protein (TIGR00251 family)
MIRVTATAEGARVAVLVQPRANRTELVGTHGDALKVRLQAPPVDGAANEALVQLVAKSLGVRPRQVRIARGATSRLKEVEILGVDATMVTDRLCEVLATIEAAKRAGR